MLGCWFYLFTTVLLLNLCSKFLKDIDSPSTLPFYMYVLACYMYVLLCYMYILACYFYLSTLYLKLFILIFKYKSVRLKPKYTIIIINLNLITNLII